jgi:hypothetical protein
LSYILKYFDTPLIRFTVTEDSALPAVSLDWITEEDTHLLPLDLEPSPDGLVAWLKRRVIPKNRAYVHAFLAKCGLNANRPLAIIDVCKGLSLNDCYWVVTDDFTGEFSDFNLYDNKFSNIIAQIAFSGYGSSIRTSLASSPEFTTNGMLPKCWRRIDGKIMLYKGGTCGASNTGFEPYSEFYASQVAEAMGISAIRYSLSQWKGQLCSTCDIFTSKKYSFLPVGKIIRQGGFSAISAYLRQLGSEFSTALDDMLVFDALIFNTDRHFGNFGFLVDTMTNRITAPAPLFDHGNSLFSLASLDSFDSEKKLSEYSSTLVPCVYENFLEEARKVLSYRHTTMLRHLIAFKFIRHSRYNLPAQRLKRIEVQIHTVAKKLLS